MTGEERSLVLFLRFNAVLLLIAIVPALMPLEWMAAVHRALGLGELPDGLIVSYLTRSLSAMYAVHGAIVYFVSLDVRRHLPVVKCLAWLAIIFGGGMVVLDVSIGMPALWTLGEGPVVIAMGLVVLALARRLPA